MIIVVRIPARSPVSSRPAEHPANGSRGSRPEQGDGVALASRERLGTFRHGEGAETDVRHMARRDVEELGVLFRLAAFHQRDVQAIDVLTGQAGVGEGPLKAINARD